MNIESVGKAQGHAGTEIVAYAVLIDGTHFFIIDQHHHPVGFFYCIGGVQNLESIGFGNGGTFGIFIKPNNHIYSAVTQILSVGVSLTAVTDYGDSEIVEKFFVAVVVIVHLAHFLFPFL